MVLGRREKTRKETLLDCLGGLGYPWHLEEPSAVGPSHAASDTRHDRSLVKRLLETFVAEDVQVVGLTAVLGLCGVLECEEGEGS